MSNYEFWDELGKIFNAVVAYQEKNIEFNKRFINPWIRLGNVFDKQDRHREAIDAYRKAIEIDPGSAQNWHELGSAYFRTEAYDQAIDAFHKAIELDPGFGWPYSNLALTLATQGKHAEAIPLYRKSIELLEADKDKAVAWNRLGNVYRKLNDYEQAVQAFQKADELDEENAGFRDELDEAPEEASLMVEGTGEATDQATAVTFSPIQLIVEESQAEEAAAENSTAKAQSESAPVVSKEPEVANKAEERNPVSTGVKADKVSATVTPETAQASTEAVADVPAAVRPMVVAAENLEKNVKPVASESAGAPAQAVEPPALGEETVTIVVQNTVETYTDSMMVTDTSVKVADVASAATDVPTKPASQMKEAASSNPEPGTDPEPAKQTVDPATAADANSAEVLPEAKEATEIDESGAQVPAEAEEVVEVKASDAEVLAEVEELAEMEAASEGVIRGAGATDPTGAGTLHPDHAAYEEYLKDNDEALNILTVESQNPATEQELVAKIDPSGEFQIEMDTKNAHVWNELGNVYFNTGAYDDAIVAYSKAIELDRGFAWPYSNLALAYVQKGRFVEAILLYQRSIELFASEKDKAISWNRLGNVYRRLNDYENAIAAYQRADDLDPNNTTLSLQSRFSLLGNYHVEQKPSYVS